MKKSLHVFRDVIIVLLLAASGLLIIHYAHNIQGKNLSTTSSILILFLFSIAGFTIVGYLTTQNRWKHLSIVAMCVCVICFVSKGILSWI